MTDHRPDLTLVVPTYNERGHLEDLADQLFAAADEARLALELVVVDDNSPDGTGEIADRLAARRPVRVIHRAGKLGLGSAVVEGVRVARAEVVGVIDADFSHPPALVPRMYAAFVATKADMLVASRYIEGGGTTGWPLPRRMMSRVACWLARPLTPIRDAVSGFFMIRRALAERTVVKADGFKIGLELLVRARPARLVELPFRFANRKAGKDRLERWRKEQARKQGVTQVYETPHETRYETPRDTACDTSSKRNGTEQEDQERTSTAAARRPRPVEISEGTHGFYCVIAEEALDLSIRQDGTDSLANVAEIFKTLCAQRKVRYDGDVQTKAINAVLVAHEKRAKAS